jgi:alcohol dehydrogenase
MKALVYHGPGMRSWEEVPDARIEEPTDVVVRVDSVTICGTDLHILGGDVPEVTSGRILGHEAVGTVTAIGSGVQKLAVGDRVLISCITSCGSCRYCREGVGVPVISAGAGEPTASRSGIMRVLHSPVN